MRDLLTRFGTVEPCAVEESTHSTRYEIFSRESSIACDFSPSLSISVLGKMSEIPRRTLQEAGETADLTITKGGRIAEDRWQCCQAYLVLSTILSKSSVFGSLLW